MSSGPRWINFIVECPTRFTIIEYKHDLKSNIQFHFTESKKKNDFTKAIGDPDKARKTAIYTDNIGFLP